MTESHDHHDHDHHTHDHHTHDHHHHDHGHHHAPANPGTAFAIGAAVNLAFVVLEVLVGLTANSIALVADAAHNLGDVLGLRLALAAVILSRRPPTPRRTYGWGRSSILAALANAAVLLISVGAIALEAVHRLLEPQPVQTGLVMAVAAAGIVVNGGTALLFLRDRQRDLNIRAQFAHLAGDALISLGVVVTAVAIRFTGLYWLDPLVSLLVAGLIAIGTWGLLRESLGLALDAVPARLRHEDVAAYLTTLPGVTEVHDLHIWGLSTTETALTAHLVHDGTKAEDHIRTLPEALRRRFGIGHVTVQWETAADAVLCHLRPDHVV